MVIIRLIIQIINIHMIELIIITIDVDMIMIISEIDVDMIKLIINVMHMDMIKVIINNKLEFVTFAHSLTTYNRCDILSLTKKQISSNYRIGMCLSNKKGIIFSGLSEKLLQRY